jgi:spermidine synthase
VIGAARSDRLLAILFALSGAAGLIHEIVWARALGLSLGNSLTALTGVLVAFLGGLGLGAVAGTRLAGRSRSPLRTYAVLEIGIALYGLAGPLVAVAVERLIRLLGPGCAHGAPLSALRLALAVSALAAPTLAMGATFPCVVRHAVARGATPGAAVALLYGANTLGAALGSLAASFLLLPLLGTRLTFVAGAVINAVAGAVALRMARWCPAPGAGPSPPPGIEAPHPVSSRRIPALAALAAAACGVTGALLQFGWVRAVTLSFGSSIYALGLTLAAYILGIGLGPLAVRRRLAGTAPPARLAGAAQVAAGLSALLLLPLFGLLPVAAAALSGRMGHHPAAMLLAQFALVGALILIPTLAHGAAFPALAALAAGSTAGAHRAAGLIYAASTWGSVAGFLAAGFLALPLLGTRRTIAAAAFAAVVTGAALLAARPLPVPGEGLRAGIRRCAMPLLLVAAAGAIAAVLPRWDPSLIAGGGFLYGPIYGASAGPRRQVSEAMRRRGDILYYRESGGGLVTVRRSPAGLLSMQVNGKTEASTGGDLPTQLLAAHLPLLLHPRAEEVLVIGLASGITLGAAERHASRSIGVVEIAPAVVEAARLFDPHNGRALDDPRVEVVIDDARGLLLSRRRTYDVIVSQPSNPWVAGVANLFTVEFYRLARQRLRPGGLLCQWLQAYRLPPEDLRGIVASFLEVFPGATLWEESAGGGDYFLIGGPDQPAIDPALLERPGSEAAWEELRRAGVSGPAGLLARFVAGPRGLAALAAGARRHTDDSPYLEWRAPLALFRDTLKEQVAGLRRSRESVLPYLSKTSPEIDPDLLRALGAEIRRREERLALLESLRQADLEGLADPFLAAGAEYLKLGWTVEAIEALNRAAAGSDGSPAVHLLLGEAYRAAGLPDAAMVAYRRAIAIDPDFAPAWNALGREFSARGLWAQARVVFEEAVRADPGLSAARNNLGAVLLRLGDLEGAGAAFRRALADDPLLAAARVNLGLLLKRRGDLKGSESEYRAALELEPLGVDARYNLAVLLRETGRAGEARRELEKLLELDPGDAGAREALDEIAAAPESGS